MFKESTGKLEELVSQFTSIFDESLFKIKEVLNHLKAENSEASMVKYSTYYQKKWRAKPIRQAFAKEWKAAIAEMSELGLTEKKSKLEEALVILESNPFVGQREINKIMNATSESMTTNFINGSIKKLIHHLTKIQSFFSKPIQTLTGEMQTLETVEQNLASFQVATTFL